MADFNVDIKELIPQREPFIMIDKLLFADEDFTKTSFTINSENLFCRNGYFSEAGLIETMSQTGAAGIGFYTKNNNLPTPIGFIGALKNLKIHFLPEVDSVIEGEMRIETKMVNVSIAKAKIICNQKIAAEGEFKIFIIENLKS